MAIKNVATEIVIGQNMKERLRHAVDGYLAARKQRDNCAELLEAATARFREWDESALPALLLELGVDKVTLDDGTVVKRTESFTASVSQRNETAAARIFKRLKAGDLVQSAVAFTFGERDAVKLKGLLAWTKAQQVPCEVKSQVNTGSLKSWARAMLKEGRLQPDELATLGVFRLEHAEVKEPDVGG